MRNIVLISLGICMIAIGVIYGLHGINGAGAYGAGAYCGTAFSPGPPGPVSGRTLGTDCQSFRDLREAIVWGLIGIGAILAISVGAQRLSGTPGDAHHPGR